MAWAPFNVAAEGARKKPASVQLAEQQQRAFAAEDTAPRSAQERRQEVAQVQQLNAAFEEDWQRQAGGAAVGVNKTVQEQRASLDRSHSFLAAMMDKARAASSVALHDRQRSDPASDGEATEVDPAAGGNGSGSESSTALPRQQPPHQQQPGQQQSAERGAAPAVSPDAAAQLPVPRAPPPALPAAAVEGGGEPELPNSTFECPLTLVRSTWLSTLL